MNPALKAEVNEMRGVLYERAAKETIPEHFTVEPTPDSPSATITDTRTGHSIDVGLCYLPGALKALAAFG